MWNLCNNCLTFKVKHDRNVRVWALASITFIAVIHCIHCINWIHALLPSLYSLQLWFHCIHCIKPYNFHRTKQSFHSLIKVDFRVFQNHRKQVKINNVFQFFPLLSPNRPPRFWIFQIRQLLLVKIGQFWFFQFLVFKIICYGTMSVLGW